VSPKSYVADSRATNSGATRPAAAGDHGARDARAENESRKIKTI
jgi:hypothetical protein